MKIGITGASGFLGRSLQRHLADMGFSVCGFGRTRPIETDSSCQFSICEDSLSFHGALQAFSPDCIIHCIASYGDGNQGRDAMFHVNFTVGKDYFDIVRGCKIPLFIYIDTALPREINEYAATKALFRDYLASNESSTKVIDILLENFYGPGRGDRSLISKIIRSLYAREPRFEFTEGYQQRDFIYIDDVCNAIAFILSMRENFKKPFAAVSLGTGSTISIRELVELILRCFPEQTLTEMCFGVLPHRTAEVQESRALTSWLYDHGWSPLVSMSEGIRRCIEYYKK